MIPLFYIYPFSGPDFLHAFQFYPNANEYILLALEEVGTIPDFKSISEDSTEVYARNLNIFLRDIYLRSYFITGNMIDDISENKVNGILSTLYWFIKKTNHEIISVEKITLDSLGNIIEKIILKKDGIIWAMMVLDLNLKTLKINSRNLFILDVIFLIKHLLLSMEEMSNIKIQIY